eukprot:6745476-Lingulodinium_polyedra.AAC.1
MGHVVNFCMLAWPLLSLFRCVYGFVGEHLSDDPPLPPAAARELYMFRAAMPLVGVRLAAL